MSVLFVGTHCVCMSYGSVGYIQNQIFDPPSNDVNGIKVQAMRAMCAYHAVHTATWAIKLCII